MPRYHRISSTVAQFLTRYMFRCHCLTCTSIGIPHIFGAVVTSAVIL